MNNIQFDEVKLLDGFWKSLLEEVHKKTLPSIIEKCSKSRLNNFIQAGKKNRGEDFEPFEGRFYDDSDVYKMIEGVSAFYHLTKDKELLERLEPFIQSIVHAQKIDGYIMTYQILTDELRYTDMDRHELYCMGHLIEAAITHHAATRDDRLLTCAIKVGDHLVKTFQRHPWVTGHPEVELALMKLSDYTGDKSYQGLAEILLNYRGKGYYKSEARPIHDKSVFNMLNYAQDHCPVKDQLEATGHAVRAMYLYESMTRLSYQNVHHLWDDVVNKKMYVTGGVGSSVVNEGFTEAFDLPNQKAYAETCAGIGLINWTNQFVGHSQYGAVIERALYNNVLGALSLSRDHFFYVNPLESNGKERVEGGHTERQQWFNTSCCPTNLVRFLPKIGGLIYKKQHDALYVEQLISSEIESLNYHVKMTSQLPLGHEIIITIDSKESFELKIRKPDWAKRFTCHQAYELLDDYLIFTVNKGAFEIVISLEQSVRKLKSDNRVTENMGKVALAYGPLIYAFEGIDNQGTLESICLEDCYTRTWDDDLKCYKLVGSSTAIPYYTWGNRGKGPMKVYIQE